MCQGYQVLDKKHHIHGAQVESPLARHSLECPSMLHVQQLLQDRCRLGVKGIPRTAMHLHASQAAVFQYTRPTCSAPQLSTQQM
jgi:hypothetical protein